MLDAGSVVTTLRGQFNPAAFAEYDAANRKAIAAATQAEAQMTGAAQRGAKAHDQMAAAAGRNAAATEDVAKSGARLRETLPLAAMNEWSKNSDQAGKNLSKLGSVAAKSAAVGIVAVGAAAIYAVTKARTFNREMLKVQTQAGGSAAEIKNLSTEVLAMAGTVPQGPKELAEGLYHIESAGFRGARAISMLKASAQGAALGNANLEDTSNALVGTMASQIKGAETASGAMGTLNAIVGVGNMRFQDLDKSIATGILPTFAQAGLTLTDYGATLATITDNSTPANVAATRLRMTIAQMVSPTKAAAKELASIGLTNKSLANDLRQPDGLLVAIEDLKTHLKDSGKTAVEQDQILSNSFGRGKSSAAIMTLVGEIDRLRSKYQQLGTSDGPQKLAESWAAFQKSESANFAELRSSAQAFAITVGEVLTPELAKLAHAATHALDGFMQGGGAAKVGGDIQSAFSAIGDAVTQLAPDVEWVAVALYHAGAAASSVGQSLGIGLAGQLATLTTAFVAFKTVSFVSPILKTVAAGISAVGVAAYTAPSIAAFGADLVALAGGPIGAILVGLGLAATAFVAFQSGLFQTASAAEKNAAAMRADKQAIESLGHATENAAQKEIALQRAKLDHKEAAEGLQRSEKEVADGTLKGAAANNALLRERLRLAESANQVTQATHEATKALENETHQAEKATDTISNKKKETFKEIESVKQQIAVYKASGRSQQELAPMLTKLASLQYQYNQEAKEAAKANAEVAVSEESRLRISKSQGAITPQNAQGVQALQNALFEANAPKKIVTKYELDDQGAQAKLGELAAKLTQVGHQDVVARVLTTAPSASAAIEAFRAILLGVPASKVVSILHNAPSAKAAMSALSSAIYAVPNYKGVSINTNAASARGEVQGLQASIDGLTGKSIAITVTKTVSEVGNLIRKATGHASGRSRGRQEAALVGEGQGSEYVVDRSTGRGTVVSRPTIMGLGSDDYVIPLEDRYRGRALGLFAMLARDLEVPGYKKGKAAKPKHHYDIPNAIPPLSLPLSEIGEKQQAAKSAEGAVRSKVKSDTLKVSSLEKQVRTAERAKKPDRAKLAELHSELAKAQQAHAKDAQQFTKDKREVQEWNRTTREAKHFQTQINDRQLEVNNAGNAMKLAAGHDDFDAYNEAKAKRLGALGKLQALIKQAQAQVKTGTEYALQLEGTVQSAEEEQQSTQAETFESPADKAAEEEERTGMTSAEVAEGKRIEKDIALAALTSGLEDDKKSAQELVSFLEHVLGETEAEPGPRGGDESIKNIADALKTAQNNLASLSGSGTNENADLQAQVEQANQKADTAKQEAQIANRALEVFGGSGDIGSGGPNAARAAGQPSMVQNNYMLHPSDPQVLATIGAAATAGIGYQGSRRAVRSQVGP